MAYRLNGGGWINMAKGKFVVVDGLDGVGKGVFLDTFVEEARNNNKTIFDVHDYWKKHNYQFHPSVRDFQHADVIVTSEPTYVGPGKFLREEAIAKNMDEIKDILNRGRKYSVESIMELFAVDRRILHEQVLIPALELGIDVYQSRSFSSSITYQRQMALDREIDISIEDILEIPGNKFCLEHCMDYLVIPTVDNFEDLMDRLKVRDKKDNCIYEQIDFQRRLKPAYEHDDFKKIFSERGVGIQYMNAGISVSASQQQARDFSRQYLL